MNPIIIQRIEGVFFFLAALWAFNTLHASWIFFLLFLLAPDLSMIGYLRNPQFGAKIYNLAHMYALPVVAAAIGYGFDLRVILGLAIIWFAHIGMDRALGYGLKLPTGFKDTHLGSIGKS